MGGCLLGPHTDRAIALTELGIPTMGRRPGAVTSRRDKGETSEDPWTLVWSVHWLAQRMCPVFVRLTILGLGQISKIQTKCPGKRGHRNFASSPDEDPIARICYVDDCNARTDPSRSRRGDEPADLPHCPL